VTLGAGASIVVKDSGEEIPLLEAVSETLLTPTAGLTLMVDFGDKKITQGASSGGHTVTITSGHLAVAPGASYVVESVSSNIGKLTVTGKLSFETDNAETDPKIGKLALTGATSTGGAKLAGTGTVFAGGAEITGAWEAVDSSPANVVTLSYDGIAAAAGTVVFTATDATAAITVPAGKTLEIAANTTIELVNDISATDAKGTITLKAGGGNAEGGKIVFKGATSIIKSGDEADGSGVTLPIGAFVAPEAAASGKITVSSTTNIKVYEGGSTSAKLNSIKATTDGDYIQAFAGEGEDGVINIDTPIS
jgi:hypothetical protein